MTAAGPSIRAQCHEAAAGKLGEVGLLALHRVGGEFAEGRVVGKAALAVAAERDGA